MVLSGGAITLANLHRDLSAVSGSLSALLAAVTVVVAQLTVTGLLESEAGGRARQALAELVALDEKAVYQCSRGGPA